MRIKNDIKEQLILNTALALIERVGLTGLKMTDLARGAGVAIGTLYIYFRDKQALLERLYLDLVKKTTIDLTQDIDPSWPLKVRIQKISFNYLKLNLEHPEYQAFFDQFFRSPFAAGYTNLAGIEAGMLEPVRALVLQGQQEKLFKDGDPDLLVVLVCGMLTELARSRSLENRLVSNEEWNLTFQMLWDSLQA